MGSCRGRCCCLESDVEFSVLCLFSRFVEVLRKSRRRKRWKGRNLIVEKRIYMASDQKGHLETLQRHNVLSMVIL
jgi:hypothetical protein